MLKKQLGSRIELKTVEVGIRPVTVCLVGGTDRGHDAREITEPAVQTITIQKCCVRCVLVYACAVLLCMPVCISYACTPFEAGNLGRRVAFGESSARCGNAIGPVLPVHLHGML